jgi:hypothetical protein
LQGTSPACFFFRFQPLLAVTKHSSYFNSHYQRQQARSRILKVECVFADYQSSLYESCLNEKMEENIPKIQIDVQGNIIMQMITALSS